MSELGADLLFTNDRMSSDSSIAYATYVRSVLPGAVTVVDVGCGRGQVAEVASARPLFDFRAAGRTVVGVDVDTAGAANPLLDEFRQIGRDLSWPIDDCAADVVVSDWTLEHVDDPHGFTAELRRVLRPGGVFVARTVSRWSPLALGARIVPNRLHTRALAFLQPSRRDVDVFPTRYRMNSASQLQQLLGPDFEFTLTYRPTLDTYVARVRLLARIVAAIESRLPRSCQSVLIVCARRRPTGSTPERS